MNAALIVDPETGYIRPVASIAEAHADAAFAVAAPRLSKELDEREAQDEALRLVEDAGQAFACEIYVASLVFGASVDGANATSQEACAVFVRRFREQVADWRRGGRA